MIRFELDVSAADLAARTIEGVMVPFGEVATVEGVDYRFRPGSVTLARARMPLLVDHDPSAPIGVLAGFDEQDAGVLARFSIDETAAGDTALVQAASGSRGGFSVGAALDETSEADGVVDVTAARVLECSLVSLGAFEGAAVTRVAAQADDDEPEHDVEPPPTKPEPEPDTGVDVPDPDQTELPLEEPPEPPAEPAERKDTMEATAPPVVMADRSPAPRELNAGELVGLMIRSQLGDKDSMRYLEAALTESISTDVAGLLPPQYERTVIGAKSQPRPLFNSFRSRPLPGVGLAVNKPKWTTPPDGAWAASVDADATSNKVVIGSQAAAVERWDWAGAIPWVVVQRSDPSIIDEIYAEAVEDFHFDVEAKIAGELAAAPVDLSTTLGGAISAFYDATDKTPEVIIVAPDVWGEMADARAFDSSVGAGDSTTATGELRASFAGIPITASGSIPAGSRYLATRRAIDARVTEPVRLTANAIGALNVELAVVGEGLFDTDYPAELMALTAGAPLEGRSRSSSK